MKIPAILRNNKRYLIGLIFCLCQFYAYGQACDCPAVGTCGACQGGLTSLTFRYNGGLAIAVSASDGSGLIYSNLFVFNGEIFTLEGPLVNGKFQGQVTLSVNGFPHYVFETNCSTPFVIGDDYGSFTLLAAESFAGGPLCCQPGDQDNVAPTISSCPANIVVPANASCLATVNWTAPTAADNCGAVTLTSTHAPGSSFPKGTTLVQYTATDDYGNTATCSFNVTVTDNTNPVIAGCPSNVIVSADASCQAVANWTVPTVSDNCGGTVTLTGTKAPGDLFNLGTTAVTYTATDAAGNTSTCSFNVIVQDNTNPIIAGCPSNIVVSANASCQAIVNWAAPTFSDNCAGGTLTSTKNPGDVFTLGTTIVTYTATDGAGNTATCSFDVVVQDNTSPVIAGCPSNIVVSANVSCQAVVNWTTPTLTDNCGGTLTLTSTKNPGDVFSLGTTTVTYTATDAAGNTSTCSFDVLVQDSSNPVITGCPSNIVVSADASCQAVVSWTTPTFSDNCAGGTLTSNRNPGDLFPLGTTTVTYTATDAAGNVATCSFDVLVQDNTNPVIAGCPSNITVSANASCQAVVSWTTPTFSDNCAGGTLTSNRNPGDVFALGTTTVTYTATDAAGNVATCSFDVLVQDNTNPVITGCPSNITVSANASCQAIVNWTAPSFSDNCAGGMLTSTKNPGDVFALGTTTVAYTATDAAGNISTCSFDVVVQDNTNPVITGCPSNTVVSANSSCQAVVSWTAPAFSDNCAGGTLTSTKNPGDVFALGTTTVTYTATDAAGNISTCSFDVVVQDNTNPVITGCPSNIVASSNASCQAVVSWTAPAFSDNCAGGTLTSTKNPGDVFGLGATTVTYTATDAAGNIATCSFDVIVQDNTNPVIAGCPSNIVVSANASCQAVVNWTAPTFSDNCAGGTLTSTKNPGDIFALGTTTVTYTATDAAGNIATCSFDVIVQDNTNPVIAGCLSNIVVSANASCQAVVTWTAPTVSDNCGGTVTLTSTKSPGDVFALGTTTVTYTGADAAGNTSTCSFDVVVQDDTNPVITGCPSDIAVSANASCQAIVNWTAPTVSDNCGGPVAFTSNKSSGDVFPLGTTTVTYTARDAAGNTSTCSFNVVVQDNSNPVVSGCPADLLVNANASCQAVVNWTLPTVSDNCAGVTLSSTKNPGDIFSLGTTTVTYTATDAAGNVTSCSFNVVVQDNTNPVIAGCPSNIVVSANASCQANVSWTAPTVSDNCAGIVIFSGTKNPGDIFPLGTTTVTYTATDAAGNTSACSFDVVVVDNTNPVITGCPSDIMANADASCGAVVNWTVPAVSDNCNGVVTLTSTKNPGDIFPLGTTVVTYTATDAVGNASTCSFNVVIGDNTNPVISGCPSDITVNANASCQMAVSWTIPTASDNCAGVTLTSTKNPGDNFPIGTTTVSYTATDAANNSTTCTFDVIVRDNSAPVIAGCPSNLTVAANASCEAIVNWTPPTMSDNCSGATLTASKIPGDVFPLGTTVVTYTATDAAGNASTCSFNVVVQDNSRPVINGCPSDIVVNVNASCQAVVSWVLPTASDNCSGTVTLSGTKNPGDNFPLGTTLVTYTATDAAGNIATCAFNVTVEDNVAPQFAGCADIGVTAGASCETPVQWTSPFAADCSPVVVTSSHNPGDTFPLGTTEVTYTATDSKGNTSICKFNVIVEDKTAPVFLNCPADMTITVTNACEAAVSWSVPAVSDNCQGVTLTRSHTPGDLFPAGKTVVKYTATDAAGNKSECEFEVTVKIGGAPVFENCPADQDLTAEESGIAIVNWTPPAATASCGDVVLTSTHSPGDIFSPGATIVTYKAEDAFGNVSYCEFKVIVTPQEIDIAIGRLVTPDGNSDNDELIITNIEKFVKNKIIIVDRWGSVVYTASGYNNASVVWTGLSREGASLPTGTYFYTISVQYADKVFEKTGFIELIR